MAMETSTSGLTRQRTRYIPVETATVGMTLADGVQDKWRRTIFPSGTTLTPENIQQLQAHGVEFICVSYAEDRSPDVIAVETAIAARQVLEVFSQADLSNPTMAALFNQVLIYRSA